MEAAHKTWEHERDLLTLVAETLVDGLLWEKYSWTADDRLSCGSYDRLIDLLFGTEVAVDIALRDIAFTRDHLKRSILIAAPDKKALCHNKDIAPDIIFFYLHKKVSVLFIPQVKSDRADTNKVAQRLYYSNDFGLIATAF